MVSVLHDERLDIPNSIPPLERDRRETERAITYWYQETIRVGHAPTLTTLISSDMLSEKWAHRFIVSIDPIIENWALLFYGDKFAALLALPKKRDINLVSLTQTLPARFLPVFTKGCTDTTSLGVPIRMEGAIEREDGRRELYRAVFITLQVRLHGLTSLAFGTFNCRVEDSHARGE